MLRLTSNFILIILTIACAKFLDAGTPMILARMEGEAPRLDCVEQGCRWSPPPPVGYLRKAGCPETIPAHFWDLEIKADYWLVSGYAIGDDYTPGWQTADGWEKGLRREVRPGITIACPKELPLGTVVIIDKIGPRVCEDRGGAIIGKRLDVAFKTPEGAMIWGVRWVRLAIIK